MTLLAVAVSAVVTLAVGCGGSSGTSSGGPQATPRPSASRAPLDVRYDGIVAPSTTLAQHTVYQPADLGAVKDLLPIVVWGNGGCQANGTQVKMFLQRLASYGILAVASGDADGKGASQASWLLDAVTWATAENARPGSPYQGKLDTHAISAQGLSCGGLEALDVSADPRISSTILWSSGSFPNGQLIVGKEALTKLHAPIAWIDGGPSDIAYPNAVDDYNRVPSTIPAVLAQYGDVGHGQQLAPAHLNEMAGVAASWIDAVDYKNAAAKARFVGPACGLCDQQPWKIQAKNWA
ncbi:hypothetical protein [Pseudofrankia inefficax]|uniref:hypothetical protein n=1 Tax=Pseudofrankia inefficax (strain DSM 45817 / CECT 9037 / DDB 130130 / EuI1c) TaxID=298654 RepID=UPI00030880F8|nr:hypothetical protein [Pseudofrankia inefficax]